MNPAQTKEGMSSNSLFDWVTIAKGLAIILVVMGHYLPDQAPAYWRVINKTIYAFHMPLFFVLSGFLYTHERDTWSQLIRQKVTRLLYPFFSIAAIFFFIKSIAAIFFSLDHPVEIKSLLWLLINPVRSYMPLLWFVHTLFFIFMIYPLLRRYLIKGNLSIFLVFLLINTLFWTDGPTLFSNPFLHIPFFVFGVALRENSRLRSWVLSGNWLSSVLWLSLFILMLFVGNRADVEGVIRYPYKVLIGTLGTLMAANTALFIASLRLQNGVRAILMTIGYHSMTIYLFHTLFVSAVRIGTERFLNHFPFDFEVSIVAAVSAGVFFPLLFEKKVLRNSGFTRKYILGLS